MQSATRQITELTGKVQDGRVEVEWEIEAFEEEQQEEKEQEQRKQEREIIYVRDLEADKPEAQPDEKVTYKVTKYSQEKVSENDKKRIQWAIKIDGEKQLLKEKGEKLVLTIKEEWAGKEIIVMPFLVKPSEKVSEKVKVIKFPMLIVQGKKRVGKNEDGTLANDLYFGDYEWDKEKIKQKLISDLQRQGEYSETNKNKINKILDKIWKYKVLVKEELQKEFLGSSSINWLSKPLPFFNKFVYGTTDNYHSITAPNGISYDVKKIEGELLQDALQTEQLKSFVEATKAHIENYIKENEINFSELQITGEEKGKIYDNFLKSPIVKTINFSLKDNPSLVYVMHSVWAYKIYLEKYDKNTREGVLKYRLYDHFGLDVNDIFSHTRDIFIEWFILQHFYGVKPFITEIVFDVKIKF